jgi:hypothetical protein
VPGKSFGKTPSKLQPSAFLFLDDNHVRAISTFTEKADR